MLRNETWRQWIAKAVKSRVPGAEKLLAHFTANSAKWRFETIIVVQSALLRLRGILPMYLREELFQDAQDKVLVQAAVNAARDPWLWKWMENSMKYCFEELEHVRRWGMICDCQGCNDKRKTEGKAIHIPCLRNSRRMRNGWTWIQQRIEALRATATTLTPDMCEGSQSLCQILKGMCRKAADLLRRRFKYLSVVPWLLVTANTIEGAAECLAQILARPLEEHDGVTRDFEARLGEDLRIRAAGGACSKALEDETKAIENTPFDEACGEGYHRETNHEKKRAPASTTAHLKRHTRVNKSLQCSVGLPVHRASGAGP